MIYLRLAVGFSSLIKRLIVPQRFSTTMADVHIVERWENILKPREDKRDYLGLKLKNKLQILLVSDPETDISATSLSVNVGSMSDPWDIQGLAHFLEHMLFMGTEKYPSENEYSKFLSQHGGSSNAYTSDNITNYYFDVSPEYLESSLDRFSQFFITPLMLEDSVNRELDAVNSEFDKNLDNDDWRLLQIKKSLSDSNHDFHKFNIGNYETLRDSPNSNGKKIREELLKFYNRWYSANIMCLCVLGKEKMEDLVKMVVPLFSPIINKDVVAPSWPTHPFSEKSLMKRLDIVPIKDKNSIKFIFKYPDETMHYKASPGFYLAHLLGYEGKGSLLSELKHRSLCSSLYSYFDKVDGFGFFYIGVDITEEALNKVDEISLLLFQYIELLKTGGPKKYIFDESKELGYIRFHFMEKSNPMEYVQRLSSLISYYPMEDILSASLLIDQYKPELITEMLEYLKPENCNIVVISKSFEGKTDMKEKYYGTNYRIMDLNTDLIVKLKNPGLNDKFTFPEKNEFIPTKFEIIQSSEKQVTPEKIIQTDFLNAWYMKDDIYLRPKVYYALKVVNPISYTTPFNVNANSMFVLLLKDALNEFLYDASLAGLSFILNTKNYGFNMVFYGYDHKMDIFLQRVLERIVNFEIDPQRFEIVKEKYSKVLLNYKTQPLYHLATYYLKLVTSETDWTYEDLTLALQKLTVESIKDYIKIFFTTFTIDALFHGNISRPIVEKVCNLIKDKLISHYNAVPFAKHPSTLLRQIALKGDTSCRFEVPIDVQKMKAANSYFEVCFDNAQDTSKLLLVEQLLNEPFFNILRTKEQLGYIVYSTVCDFSGVGGMSFVIQSDYGASYLDARIEAFLVWAKDYIANMNEDEFTSEKKSLISKLLKKKKRMIHYSNELFLEIINEEYNFKKNENYAALTENLTKENILAFYQKHFLSESTERKKLAIHIIKSDPKANESVPKNTADLNPTPPIKDHTLIKDAFQFKRNMSLHPLPTPKLNIS